MITAIIAFLAQVPGLLGVAQKWAEARYNSQVQITTARIGGNVEAAKAIVAAQVAGEQSRVSGLTVIAGNKILTMLVVAFASPLALYLWKIVVWDKILGLGSTDPLCKIGVEHCFIADNASTIIYSIFGSTAAVGGISAAVNLMRKA